MSLLYTKINMPGSDDHEAWALDQPESPWSKGFLSQPWCITHVIYTYLKLRDGLSLDP